MLVLGMLFGVLVLGPVLVLGALALANNERAMARIGGLRRRGLPHADSPVAGASPAASDDAGAPSETGLTADAASPP